MKRLSPLFLRYFIYNNACVSVLGALTSGELLTAYALALGASPFVIGCLGGLPYLGTGMNVVGAHLVSRGYSAKKTTIFFSALSRPFYLICGMWAFFPHFSYVVTGLMCTMFFCYVVGGISAGSYYPWLKALLPTSQVHDFVQQKYIAMKISHILGFLGVILLLKLLTPSGENPSLPVYALIFSLAFIMGVLSVICFFFIPAEKKSVRASRFSWKLLKQTGIEYRPLFWAVGCCFFALLFFTTFIPVFVLQVGKITVEQMILLSLIGQIFFLISLPWWKKLNERTHSLRSVQIAFTSLVILISLTICLLSKNQAFLPFIAGILFLFSSLVQAGIMTGIDTTILAQAPDNDSSIFFTMISLVELTTIIGPICAGACWMGLNKFGNIFSVEQQWQLFLVISVSAIVVALHACYKWVQYRCNMVQ